MDKISRQDFEDSLKNEDFDKSLTILDVLKKSKTNPFLEHCFFLNNIDFKDCEIEKFKKILFLLTEIVFENNKRLSNRANLLYYYNSTHLKTFFYFLNKNSTLNQKEKNFISIEYFKTFSKKHEKYFKSMTNPNHTPENYRNSFYDCISKEKDLFFLFLKEFEKDPYFNTMILSFDKHRYELIQELISAADYKKYKTTYQSINQFILRYPIRDKAYRKSIFKEIAGTSKLKKEQKVILLKTIGVELKNLYIDLKDQWHLSIDLISLEIIKWNKSYLKDFDRSDLVNILFNFKKNLYNYIKNKKIQEVIIDILIEYNNKFKNNIILSRQFKKLIKENLIDSKLKDKLYHYNKDKFIDCFSQKDLLICFLETISADTRYKSKENKIVNQFMYKLVQAYPTERLINQTNLIINSNSYISTNYTSKELMLKNYFFYAVKKIKSEEKIHKLKINNRFFLNYEMKNFIFKNIVISLYEEKHKEPKKAFFQLIQNPNNINFYSYQLIEKEKNRKINKNLKNLMNKYQIKEKDFISGLGLLNSQKLKEIVNSQNVDIILNKKVIQKFQESDRGSIIIQLIIRHWDKRNNNFIKVIKDENFHQDLIKVTSSILSKTTHFETYKKYFYLLNLSESLKNELIISEKDYRTNHQETIKNCLKNFRKELFIREL